MTINYKEELTNALEYKENKNKQEIVKVIFQNIPKTKELNIFKFICEKAANTAISKELAEQITNSLFEKDDIETVNDAGDIMSLQSAGDVIDTIDVDYIYSKYKDLFEQISLPLYDEFIAKYSASTEFIKIIVKLLDEFDAATLQKMYEECVDKLYIEVIEETDDENSATENGIEQDSKNDEEDEKDA